MNTYEARHAGRDYCNTEGSDHYKGGIEPLDLMISLGIHEDFCIGNVLKYARRFKKTRNPDDLKKVSDYAHILCGVEIGKASAAEIVTGGEEEPDVHKMAATLCGKYESDCAKCPLGMTHNPYGLPCKEFRAQHPAQAIQIMRKAVE